MGDARAFGLASEEASDFHEPTHECRSADHEGGTFPHGAFFPAFFLFFPVEHGEVEEFEKGGEGNIMIWTHGESTARILLS